MTGDLFDPPPRAPYSVTSETSGQAAASLAPRQLARYQLLVLEAVCASDGLTDEEIATRTGLMGNTVRPRRAELAERTLIRDSDRRRKTRSGRSAVVWCATPTGYLVRDSQRRTP